MICKSVECRKRFKRRAAYPPQLYCTSECSNRERQRRRYARNKRK